LQSFERMDCVVLTENATKKVLQVNDKNDKTNNVDHGILKTVPQLFCFSLFRRSVSFKCSC
jgi:hypothetical protein